MKEKCKDGFLILKERVKVREMQRWAYNFGWKVPSGMSLEEYRDSSKIMEGSLSRYVKGKKRWLNNFERKLVQEC